MKKKFIAGILSMTMAVTMLPSAAFATECESSGEMEPVQVIEEQATEDVMLENAAPVQAAEGRSLSVKQVGSGIAINSTNFPDPTFREIVSDEFDDDGNGYLSDEEINRARSIQIEDHVWSLNGLQKLTKLECIVFGEGVSPRNVNVDLTPMRNLENLIVEDNQSSLVIRLSDRSVQDTEIDIFDSNTIVYRGSKISMHSCDIRGMADVYNYTGKAIVPNISLMLGGKVLDPSEYTITMDHNTKVGIAGVTIKPVNTSKYTDSITSGFYIYPKKPAVSSIKAKKRAMTVTMSTGVASTGGTHFRIAYRVKGTSKWKYVSTKNKSITIKNLKKGKCYQVKVGAYAYEKENTVWGKTVVTKKIK